MEFVSPKISFPFMKYRFVGVVVSLVLIACAVFAWTTTGDGKYSVDFLGGNEVVVKSEKGEVDIGEIRNALKQGGIENAIVQEFEAGSQEFAIRVKRGEGSGTGQKIREVLQGIEGKSFELRREDFVGPVIGAQIRNNGLKAMLFALICILLYITVRFEWRFAVGAIIALVHDVIITSGLFIFSGREISAAVLAALLTIIGYSLNDTIIVYDRVRENLNFALKKISSKAKKEGTGKISLTEIMDRSINQTLSRTALTSLTTLFVVSMLWLLGGGAIADLAFTLVIGVIIGTYSSIFVACPSVLIWARKGGS